MLRAPAGSFRAAAKNMRPHKKEISETPETTKLETKWTQCFLLSYNIVTTPSNVI